MITMQVRAKWVRILETAGLRSTSGMGAAGGLAANDGAAAAGGAQFGNAGRGRGRSGNTAGGGLSGQPAGGAARGAFSGRGGRGGGTAGRRSRVNPRPAFPAATAANGLGTCHKFNGSRGCDRIQIDATTCEDAVTNTRFAHFCDFYDVTSRSHCLGNHGRLQGGH
jgi:hypothetical protein